MEQCVTLHDGVLQPDGGVVKKLISTGKGYVTPENGDDVEGKAQTFCNLTERDRLGAH